MQKAMTLGAFEFLNKPIDFDELEKTISKAMDGDDSSKVEETNPTKK